MVNKEQTFYLRQHSFAIKKYEKSAEECKIAREARARMERRKTLISLNPPLTQPDFNRRMTKLTILDPDSLKRLHELDRERQERKQFIRKRWRKVLVIARFNLEHKRVRQQHLTLKLNGNRPVRFEERVLEQTIKTATPPTGERESGKVDSFFHFSVPGWWKLKKDSGLVSVCVCVLSFSKKT